MTRTQPRKPARSFIHYYNLEGRHIFSAPLPATLNSANRRSIIADALPGVSNLDVTKTEETIVLNKPGPNYASDEREVVSGSFAFGPLGGVYVITGNIASPILRAYEAALIWMRTKDGIEESIVLDLEI